MDSFQAKIDRKWPRKRQKYKLSFRFVPTQCVIENFQKNSKKIQKLQNTILASFKAKIRGETLRKGENKNYRPVPFQPDA